MLSIIGMCLTFKKSPLTFAKIISYTDCYNSFNDDTNPFAIEFSHLLEKHLQRIRPGSGGYPDLPSDAEEKDEP